MHLRIGMDFRRLPYLVPVFMIPSQSIRGPGADVFHSWSYCLFMIMFPASFFKDFPYPFPLQGPDLLLSFFYNSSEIFFSIAFVFGSWLFDAGPS
jgi:hypothetical protein